MTFTNLDWSINIGAYNVWQNANAQITSSIYLRGFCLGFWEHLVGCFVQCFLLNFHSRFINRHRADIYILREIASTQFSELWYHCLNMVVLYTVQMQVYLFLPGACVSKHHLCTCNLICCSVKPSSLLNSYFLGLLGEYKPVRKFSVKTHFF